MHRERTIKGGLIGECNIVLSSKSLLPYKGSRKVGEFLCVWQKHQVAQGLGIK